MSAHTKILLISYSEEILDGEPIYVSSNSFPIKYLRKEPAGHAFHSAALLLRGFSEKKDEDSNDKSVPNGKDQTYMPSPDSYSTKGKKKAGAEGSQQDHYALLNLGHLRYLATEEQIRKSYRETALKYHPDKQAALLLLEETDKAKEVKKEQIETHFRSIQEAYEILMDPVKRRIYDSTDEFDDEIPTDCAPQDFFKVFGPAFMRNGRWSVIQPVPSLGDDTTTLKEVDNFYNFWYAFKSWREFPHEEEYDLEDADSRDHKRWMERQNAKLSEKARKEDYARIRNLIDNSYKRDPRIQRRKEEMKAEKQRKKEAKYLGMKLQEEAAAKAAEEERRRKEEDDKLAAEVALQQKKLKEKEKKLLRKERSRLRTLSSTILSQYSLDISTDDVENLCLSLVIEELKSLCDKIEATAGLDHAKLLTDACGFKNNLDSLKKQEEVKSAQRNGSTVRTGTTVPLTNYEKKEKPWAKDEIELLRKGMVKYPKGTSRRWEVISEYIGTNRSVEEILKATKTVLLQKPDSSKAFDSFLEKRKPTPSIESPLSTRDDIVGSSIPNGTQVPVVVKTDKTEDSSSKSETKSDNQAPASGGSSSSDQDQWSAIQERALVQALKTFPKEVSQRWERVSAAVPGKTVNQCKKKFTLLKENFRNKKTAV